MKLSSMSQFYRDRKAQDVEYAARHISSLGFDSVEWFETDCTEHIENVDTVKMALDKYDLDLSCYTVLVSLFSSNQEETETHILRHVQTAAMLGAKYFQHTVFPPLAVDGEPTFERVYDGIIDVAERIAKSCNELGMICIYEPQGVYFNGIEKMSLFLDDLRGRGCDVAICGDVANSFYVDVDSVDVFGRFATDIRHVHVKDVLFSKSEISGEKVRRSVGGAYVCSAELGEGSVNFGACFAILSKVGYDGAVSFEFGGSDEFTKEKLDYVKRIMKDNGLKL